MYHLPCTDTFLSSSFNLCDDRYTFSLNSMSLNRLQGCRHLYTVLPVKGFVFTTKYRRVTVRPDKSVRQTPLKCQ